MIFFIIRVLEKSYGSKNKLFQSGKYKITEFKSLTQVWLESFLNTGLSKQNKDDQVHFINNRMENKIWIHFSLSIKNS